MEEPSSSNTKRNLIILAGFFTTILLGFGVYLAATSIKNQLSVNKQEGTNLSPAQPEDDLNKKQELRNDPETYYGTILPLQITTYSLAGPTKEYPDASKDSWDQFAQWSRQNNPIIDPQTKQELRFTAAAPSKGEIQFLRHATCTDLNGDFEMLDQNSRTFAFKVIVDGKPWCKSNTS